MYYAAGASSASQSTIEAGFQTRHHTVGRLLLEERGKLGLLAPVLLIGYL